MKKINDRNFYFKIVVLMLIFGISQIAKAENPVCLASIQKLETLLKSTSHQCAKDSDCDNYYFRVDSWQPPVVLPKAAVTAEFEKSLIHQQKKVREACSKEWSGRPPTEALWAQPKCISLTCVDASRPNGN